MQQLTPFMQEQDLALVMLSEQKRIAKEYCTAITEANCPTIRRTLTQLLTDSLQCQEALFNTMKQLGWYQGETLAPTVEISAAQQRAQFKLTETQNIMQQMGQQTQIQPILQQQQQQYMTPPMQQQSAQQAAQWQQAQPQRPINSQTWQANNAWSTAQPQPNSQQPVQFRTQGAQQNQYAAAGSAPSQAGANTSTSYSGVTQPSFQQSAQTQTSNQTNQWNRNSQATGTGATGATGATGTTGTTGTTGATGATGANTVAPTSTNASNMSHTAYTNTNQYQAPTSTIRPNQGASANNTQRTSGVSSAANAVQSPQTTMSAAFVEAEQAARNQHDQPESHTRQSSHSSTSSRIH